MESRDGSNAPLVIGCAVLAGLMLIGSLAFIWAVTVRMRPVSPSMVSPTLAPPSSAPPSSGPSMPAPPVPPSPAASPDIELPGHVGGAAEVEGSLAPEVIRRVVRRHLTEVRTCYETALATDPTLTARVNVRFVIDATGSVSSAVAEGTSRTDLSDCITTSARTWTFPAPEGGGIVTVNYPFVLAPG